MWLDGEGPNGLLRTRGGISIFAQIAAERRESSPHTRRYFRELKAAKRWPEIQRVKVPSYQGDGMSKAFPGGTVT